MKKLFANTWSARLIWFSGGVLMASLLAFSFAEEQRYCLISLDKMNVLYRGIDNSMQILARGVPHQEIKIETEGLTLLSDDEYHYYARPEATPVARVRISGGQLNPTEFKFRVKNIPDPVISLGKWRGGEITVSELKAQGGISATISFSDFFCGQCDMQGYEVIYQDRRQRKRQFYNPGARFSPEVQSVINATQPGDLYIFDQAKVRCPGDTVARVLGPLTISIK